MLARVLKSITSRSAAFIVLLVFSAASVVFACMGAEKSLDLMTYYLAMGIMGGFAALSFLACLFMWKKPVVLLMHLGFACVLFGWFFNEMFCGVGSAREMDLRLRPGQAGTVGLREYSGESFDVELEDFRIDYWNGNDGAVKQYTSKVVRYDGEQHGGERCEISVNHPMKRFGWWVYQSSYQEMINPHTGKPLYFTILKCVRDIGLPYAFWGGVALLAGVFLYAVMFCVRDCRVALCAPRNDEVPDSSTCNDEVSNCADNNGMGGICHRILYILYGVVFVAAVCMLVHRGISTGHPPMQNMYEFLMCMAVMVPMLTLISKLADDQDTLLVDLILLVIILMPVCFFMDGSVKRLMPALQSPFFVPHVGAYVAGYVILVRAALGAGKRLAGLGFFLLTLGLVLGAMWGKVCWGHWWQFDPKEMWSLATWFVYAAYFHKRAVLSPKAEKVFLIVGAVMIVLTLTWINLSRIFSGMHSYA